MFLSEINGPFPFSAFRRPFSFLYPLPPLPSIFPPPQSHSFGTLFPRQPPKAPVGAGLPLPPPFPSYFLLFENFQICKKFRILSSRQAADVRKCSLIFLLRGWSPWKARGDLSLCLPSFCFTNLQFYY